MAACLVLSHGNIAQATVDASRQIVGVCDRIFALEGREMAPRELHQAISKVVESHECEDGLFILVGLRGGSYWHSAARIARQHENVEVISGFNLSMVLSFITKADTLTFHKLREAMIQDAMRSIGRFDPPKTGEPDVTRNGPN